MEKAYQNKQWLEEQYITFNKSSITIAQEIGVSKPTILNWLKKHDISTRLHSDAAKLMYSDPSKRHDHCNNRHGWKPSEELKEKYRENVKKLSKDPVVRKKLSDAHKGKILSEYTRNKISNARVGMKFDDDHRRHIKEARIKTWSDPEFKQKMSGVRKKQFKNPDTIKKMSESHKGKIQSNESREKRSLLMKDRYFSEEHRQKISASKKGPLNAMWNGGYYPKKYCFKFNKALKDGIRAEHGHKCYLCPTVQFSPGLSIHHIDYNHNAGCNNQRFALLPLCGKCHSKTNHNRWHWFNLLINYWAINPDINFGGGDYIYPVNLAGT